MSWNLTVSEKKELLFSITKKELEIEFYRGGVGAGGQKVNKTSSACRITHPASGAAGNCRTHRHQAQNRKEAFQRLIKSKKFLDWLRVETAARFQGFTGITQKVEEMMDPKNLKIEIKEDGNWTEK